ncbi:MAG TPA: ISAzo13 family transposase [Thermoanaerobaculia bacterium]|jgi:transposase|nr:ISAzo13 family transposase [Thermoanaerobaculia bacterium]
MVGGEPGIERRFKLLEKHLDERQRRLVAAAEAEALGLRGISLVSRSTGVSRRAIRQGLEELREAAPSGRSEHQIRRAGGGRKKTIEKDPSLRADLERLLEPATRGDPESPLRWTSKSVRHLAKELQEGGHQISHQLVSELLHELGYSLQANRKTLEGAEHPDRDGQFKHIHRRVGLFLRHGDPVISVDTKKKELVGIFKNGGREWRPQGNPEKVLVHDFVNPELGRAIPYGVYDLGSNSGWVSVGIDHDTASFAVESIRRWWQSMGRPLYQDRKRLLITADGGGSNGSRLRLWKVELQKLANELGMEISVCHFPPGTSKWNKIEHRLFSFISMNWRGKPLLTYQVIVSLIAATTTEEGLKVRAALDPATYPAGIKVSDAEVGELKLKPARFHGEWNYSLAPVPDLART